MKPTQDNKHESWASPFSEIRHLQYLANTTSEYPPAAEIIARIFGDLWDVVRTSTETNSSLKKLIQPFWNNDGLYTTTCMVPYQACGILVVSCREYVDLIHSF